MKSITQNIPGGWYGNDPGTWGKNYPNRKHGNVVVDPAEIEKALTWLRRRAKVTQTIGVNDGIGITYELKESNIPPAGLNAGKAEGERKVYKVCQRNGDTLSSAVLWGDEWKKEWTVLYSPEKWVYPCKRKSKLYAFRLLKDAVTFSLKEGSSTIKFEIWEAEGEGVEKVKIISDLCEKSFLHFWGYKPISYSPNYVTDAPQGTVICRRLKLLKRIG